MPVRSQARNQLLLYIDIVVLGVAALALVSAVHNAFYAGYWSASIPGAAASRATWLTLDLAVLGVALTWFLGRFYRARVREMARTY